MIRKMEEKDRAVFLKFSEMFYDSPAVAHSVPARYHEDAFSELMRSDAYAEGFMIEADGKEVGFALTAKTYSRESGGMVLWLEELFILGGYRSRGLGREYFSKRMRAKTVSPVSAWKWRTPTCARAPCTNGSGIALSNTGR